jgi:hypothetical protein
MKEHWTDDRLKDLSDDLTALIGSCEELDEAIAEVALKIVWGFAVANFRNGIPMSERVMVVARFPRAARDGEHYSTLPDIPISELVPIPEPAVALVMIDWFARIMWEESFFEWCKEITNNLGRGD